MFIKALKYIYIYTSMESLTNNFHLLEKLGTELILSYVHSMAIRCGLVWMGHRYWSWIMMLDAKIDNRLYICRSVIKKGARLKKEGEGF